MTGSRGVDILQSRHTAVWMTSFFVGVLSVPQFQICSRVKYSSDLPLLCHECDRWAQ
jgi:hypothetical protein